MTNQSILLKAAVLMLLSINFVHAEQMINDKITNATPDSHYTVHEPHADGTRTVTDKVTELMWQRCSVGQADDCSGTASTHTWQEALGLATSANNGTGTAGYLNWRLPSAKELQSIVAYDRYDPSINLVVFPNTPFTRYWSSSPSQNIRHAWSVGFNSGQGTGSTRSSRHHVRLVRSPQ